MSRIRLTACRSFWLFLLVLLLHGLAWGAGDGRAIGVAVETGYLDVRPWAYALQDPEGTLDVNAVRQLDHAGRFTPMPAKLGIPLLSRHPEVLWVRFTLASPGDRPQDVIFSAWPPYLREAALFAPTADGNFEVVSWQGMAVPVGMRRFVSHAPAFLIKPAPSGTTYYLRLATNQPVLLALRAWVPTDYQRQDSLDTLLVGFAMGAIMLMAGLNVAAWRILREKGQAYHAIYFVSFAWAIFTLYGYTGLWLCPDDPWWAWRIETIPLCLWPLVATLFVSHLFDFPRNLPWLGHLFRGVAWLQAGFLAATVAGAFDFIAPSTILVSLMSTSIGSLGVLYLIFVRGRHEYIFQMVALSLAAVSGLVILFARMAGIVSISVETATYLYQFSGVLHVFMLNGVLALRIRRSEQRYRAERQARLAAALEAEHVLERRVTARTQELSRTNADLAEEVARRVRVEGKLVKTLSSERRALEQQRTFVSIVSHEFRTPLAIINTAAQSLGLGPHRDDPTIRPRIDRIERAVGRLSRLVDTCLSEDRLLHDVLDHSAIVDMDDLVRHVCENLREEDLTRVDTELPAAPLRTTGNTELLRIAVSNLVQNALKYASGQVHVALRTEQGNIVLDVSNTGSPIPAEEQARIFERYYRGRTSSGKPGTGLGLHISQEITRRYGGDTTLLRSDERSTCFRIVLPAAPEAAALLPGGAQLPLPADDSEQDAHHPDGPGAPASAALRRSGPSLT